jgi:staphylococcal nuclease domain-containing protein 1
MHTMPVDSAAFMAEWRGTPLDAVVEQVKDGSTLRVRLLLPEGDHQVVNLALAGVRAARAAGKPGETSEPLGEEVRRPLM